MTTNLIVLGIILAVFGGVFAAIKFRKKEGSSQSGKSGSSDTPKDDDKNEKLN